MEKETADLLKELDLCDDFHEFYDEHEEQMLECSLSELLARLLEQKKLKKTQVIKHSELSEVYAYQIFSGLRIPERKKLLCIAVAMKLTISETQMLLKYAGYPMLYIRFAADAVVMYGLSKQLSVVEINELLYEYGFETLG